MARRRILPSETLAAYGATPIYPSKDISDDGCNDVSAVSTAVKGIKQQSSFIAKSTHNDNKETLQPIGILINGWKIITQSSSIGDERQMDELTMLLEETANNSNCNIDDGASSVTNALQQEESKKRRLCPPEITFMDALISFQFQKSYSTTDGTDEVDMSSNSEIRFSAQDSLLEWAEAHSKLDQKTANSTSQKTSTSTYRGVSIIRTADAKIWSNKQTSTSTDDNNISSSNSQFYYDWTFSSPYAGTIILPPCKQRATKEKEKVNDINNRKQWQPLDQSHIPFHLLQDTTQPILLFDDIHLYEDDLHDNGDVSLNIKVRVMPKCWYILQRLYVRVDYVCVKCREVRYFCLFDNNVKGCGNDVQVNTIYRDVVWREASWDELSGMSLPTDPSAWREDVNAGVTTSHTQVQTLASMLPRLLTVSLPDDLPRYSYFVAASNIV